MKFLTLASAANASIMRQPAKITARKLAFDNHGEGGAFLFEDESCKDVKYDIVDTSDFRDCQLFEDGGEQWYARETVIAEGETRPPTCSSIRYVSCSQAHADLKQSPLNGDYVFGDWGECQLWNDHEGNSVGYSRNRSVKEVKDTEYNNNGQVVFTVGSTGPPTDFSEANDLFWRSDKSNPPHCVKQNLKDGCGIEFKEWTMCIQWSGFSDIGIEDNAFLRTREHTSKKDGELLATGEKCFSSKDPKDLIREEGLGVERCQNPAELCPKEDDDDEGVEKEGCCSYDWGEWGECDKHFGAASATQLRSASKSTFMANNVPCYCTEAETQGDACTFDFRNLQPKWDGVSWKAC